MRRKVHIIVSGKGGVGKTVTLYTLYRILTMKSIYTVLLDLNATNHDIYNLLIDETSTTEKFLNHSNKHHEDGGFKYTVFDTPAYALYRRSDAYNSIGFAYDIWMHIWRVAQETLKNKTEAHLLVDTNLHPLNLYQKGPADSKLRERISKTISWIKQEIEADILLWFVWSGMPLSLYARGIGELSTDLNTAFADVLMLHVFNPSAFIPEGINTQRDSIWQSMKKLFNSEEFEEKFFYPFLPFKELHELPASQTMITNAAFHTKINAAHHDDLATFYSNIATKLTNGTRNPTIPWNIIALPNYYVDLHGYIDKIGISGNVHDQSELEERTNDFLEDLQQSLNQNNRRRQIF